jgi:membrane protein required for colicin V production
MPTLDWIFIAVLVISMLVGAWRGLVYEVLSLANWIAAFVLAQWFAPAVAHWLPMSGGTEVVRYVIGFALVFIAALFAGGMLAFVIRKLVAAVGLRPVDRVLGAAFGVLRGVVVVLVFAVVVSMTAMHSSIWWTESTGADVATVALKGLKPVLPEEFGKYLP